MRMESGERELSNLGASTNIGQSVAQGGDALPTEEARMAPEFLEKKIKALVAEILLEYNTKGGSTPNINNKTCSRENTTEAEISRETLKKPPVIQSAYQRRFN